MGAKDFLRKFGLSMTDLGSSNNGDREEVDGVILFKTPIKKVLEKLEEYHRETRERRRSLKKSLYGALDELGGQIDDLLEEKVSPIATKLEELTEHLASLDKRLSELEEQNVEREMYQRLNEELNRFQENSKLKDKKPAVKKLIALYDDLDRLEGDNYQELKKRVLRALDLLHIHPVVESTEKFDSEFQEVVEVIDADGREDLEIANVLRPGFKYKDEKIVRPQQVAVYKNKNQKEGETNERRTYSH